MKEKLLITAALPYANGPLHFGHMAGCYLPADCYARFNRLCQKEVLFICGSDEYGIAITLSAELAHRSPKEHVDYYHALNINLFARLGISFDHYSRTSWEGHIPVVQQFFLDLYQNGYIEERDSEQLYSSKEKRFLADRYVVGTCPKCFYEEARGDECPNCGGNFEATDLIHPRSKLTNSPLTLRSSRHWYLLFDRFQERLQEWIKKKRWKANVMHFVENYIQDLKPRAITRDSDWGVPLPFAGAEKKVFYVWFDAPIGYISATKEWAEKIGKPDEWKKYWLDSTTNLVQFIGKDNIPFHAIFFPAMIMGQNVSYKLVDELPANEFYNLEGKQFSKSSNWFIDVDDFLHTFHLDQLRYTLAANAPENQDSEFTWQDFFMRCNVELVGKFGNFAHRVLTFIQQNAAGKTPHCFALEEEDKVFLETTSHLMQEAKQNFEKFQLRKVAQIFIEIASLGNQYFDQQKPWKLLKNGDMRSRLQTILYLCMESLKSLAIVSYPLIPTTAEKLWYFLGFSTPIIKTGWEEGKKKRLQEGTLLPYPERLFPKIEPNQIEKEKKKLLDMTKQDLSLEPFKEEVDFSAIEALDLRIAEVIKAEKIEEKTKLLKLEIDLGIEKRTIVSGIAKFYSPEALIGKKVVVIANLKPKKIRGIESQGMLLVATNGKLIKLPECESMPAGSVIS